MTLSAVAAGVSWRFGSVQNGATSPLSTVTAKRLRGSTDMDDGERRGGTTDHGSIGFGAQGWQPNHELFGEQTGDHRLINHMLNSLLDRNAWE